MAKAFRFGVVTAGIPSSTAWIALAQRIEELGYSSLLMPDRTVTPLAVVPALATAAAVTKTLHISSYVFANDYRHPALLAREVATLDQLSNGRVEFGFGAGVSASDFLQLGLPFEDAGIRVSRFAEALTIIKQYFTTEAVNFSGKYYTVTQMGAIPRAVQEPHPPIFIGSSGRRMLTIAAREADIIAPTLKWSGQGGVDPTDVPLEEKIEWIREAAGERFEHLEFSQSEFGIELTDSPGRVMQAIRGGPQVQSRPMTMSQAIEHLLEQRDRLGISYIQVQQGQVENFAPLVKELNGK